MRIAEPVAPTMFRYYTAYGLRVCSELALPELMPASPGAADVVVRYGTVGIPPVGTDYYDGYVCGDAHEAHIFIEAICALRIREGREITAELYPGADESMLRVFLLGGAFGLLLHQRGMFVLHASAVALDEGVIAFLGCSGEGKSTMAAAMNRIGCAAIADDALAIDLSAPGAPLVYPAFPRIKIGSDAAAALGYDFEQLVVFNVDDERRDYRTVEQAPHTPLRLRAIYVLGENETVSIEPMKLQDAFSEMLSFSYAVGLLGPGGTSPSHLRHCTATVAHVPVFLLSRPRSLTMLPHVATIVADHARQIDLATAS